MSTANPFAMHTQTVWEERAGDPFLPAWLRVACLAFGRHKANGHTVFRPGQMALILGHVDKRTGEVIPMDRSNLRRAIQAAVRNGWLAQDSTTVCLVVPAHAVHGGLGSARTECPQHAKRTAYRRERIQRPALRVVGGADVVTQ